jgi:hypothetical protein
LIVACKDAHYVTGIARRLDVKAQAALSLCVLAIGLAAAAAAPVAPTPAHAPPDDVVLTPHKAFYSLKLARTNGSRAVNGVQGRISYDFSGSACEGYALKFRQISDLGSAEGQDALSDLSATSWEDGAAKKYRFTSQNKLNQQTSDSVDGHADRKADAVAVTLDKPGDKTFNIPAGVVFPTEHMRKIIAAARAGKKVLEVMIYDGSEDGEKLYNTLTVIGHPIAPGDKTPDDAAANVPQMAKLTRWPVTVSYFDSNPKKERSGEETPSYSIGFELYENGISRELMLNYADFSISGELVSLDVKKAKPCR